MLRACKQYEFNSSTDSQFTETEEDITFYEACVDCDEDALYDIIQDGVVYEQVNERDRSGRTGLSHACGNGFMPILELLAQVEEVDINLPDKEGNTPLIFAAQAGHADGVNFVLHNFRRIRIDQCNNAGFTALMKAAIQGRTRCAKLLLFAGANPNRRDHGRSLCAEEWARFCGRHTCADAISKYVHSKKYFLKKTFMLTREKWSSEPDLQAAKKSRDREQNKSGNWISRHLSFKRKGKRGGIRGGGGGGGLGGGGSGGGEHEGGTLGDEKNMNEIQEGARSLSSPILLTTESTPPGSPAPQRRPSCIDGVVPMSILPRLNKKFEKGRISAVGEEEQDTPQIVEPPKITQTDADGQCKTDGVS